MKSVLVYTVHKAASMFLHRLTLDVTRLLNIDYYSINKEEYYDLIKKNGYIFFTDDLNKKGCFGPIRGGREFSCPKNIETYSIILHLRDPRDVLTSLYFSHAYSHSRKEGRFNPSDEQRELWREDGIDKFVTKKAFGYKDYYTTYCKNLLGRENVIFIKYENMVSNYKQWLEHFLSAFYCMNSEEMKNFNILDYRNIYSEISKKLIYIKLYRKYRNEFKVSSENINRHKRQIIPGDYKRKLSPETIQFLNHEFRDILTLLKYES